MNKRKMVKYEKLLNGKIQSLINRAVKPVGGSVQEGGNIPDPNDRASLEADRNLSFRFRDRERKLILKAKQALARIENGTYGYCEMCGESIQEHRLAARPEASLCIECKLELEEKERMYRRLNR